MKKTLQKALDELNKENPRIDYVRGILEVLVDEEEPIKPLAFTPAIPNLNPSVNPHGLPPENVGMDILGGNHIK